MLKKVTVVGAGQMGSGIAQAFAQQGRKVTLIDIKEEQLKKAKISINKSAIKLLEKGKIDQVAMTSVQENIEYITKIEALAESNFIIEAVPEDKTLKFNLIKDLDKYKKDEAILASNTSSISITELASKTKTPEKFIGMHFMNPVPLMKMVEIIPGLQTSPEVIKETQCLVNELDKQSVISRDFPGFIVNRILMPMINEAFNALAETVGTAKEIDSAMKLSTNQPMGPLQLADFIGLDTCLAIMNVLFDGFKDSRYRPSPLLSQYVKAGWLGRKTKRGVYEY